MVKEEVSRDQGHGRHQLIEGIEEFIISGDDDLVPVWKPYIDKLKAFKDGYLV